MAERINGRPEKGVFSLDSQADARLLAFVKKADQAECGERLAEVPAPLELQACYIPLPKELESKN